MVSTLDVDFIRKLVLHNNNIKEKQSLTNKEQKEVDELKTTLDNDYLPGFEDIGKEYDMVMGCDSILKNCQGFFNYIKIKSIDISYNEYIKTYTRLAEKLNAKPSLSSGRMFLLSFVLVLEKYLHLDQSELNEIEKHIQLIKTPIVSFTKDRSESEIIIRFTEIDGNFELILPYFISKSLLEITKYEAVLGLGVAYTGADRFNMMLNKEENNRPE